jgi:hypothetical protein
MYTGNFRTLANLQTACFNLDSAGTFGALRDDSNVNFTWSKQVRGL